VSGRFISVVSGSTCRDRRSSESDESALPLTYSPSVMTACRVRHDPNFRQSEGAKRGSADLIYRSAARSRIRKEGPQT
jgi:hypothetical protein